MLSRKKENKSPAFQFYARDFLADINVQLMNMEQRGMYITLLSYAWLEKGIPNNMRKLKLLCNNPNDFDELIVDVLACFEESDGRLYNRRMESVRAEQIERKSGTAYTTASDSMIPNKKVPIRNWFQIDINIAKKAILKIDKLIQKSFTKIGKG